MIKHIFNIFRGSLMGIAEVIPGVSGGTIALIVGVYYRLIDQAESAVRALALLTKPKLAFNGLAKLNWGFLFSIFFGMALAVILGAQLIENLLENYPIQLRGLFAGLVLAGIYVPYKLVNNTQKGNWKLPDFALGLIAAVAAFLLTGIGAREIQNPSFIVIFFSAAIAICALVLPGVSGSFFLLSIGLYEPTISAVNDRNFGYLGVFALGAFFGLSSFVLLLKWLLVEKPRPTLVVISGLMLGSLRALWPWQNENRDLLLPSEAIVSSLISFVLGMAIVWLLLNVEKKIAKK